MNAEQARRGFNSVFGGVADLIVRAPGRVNLIGDHTDYTGGFVLPMAIDRALFVAARRAHRAHVRVFSLAADACVELRAAAPPPPAGWARYPAGVLALLARRGNTVSGADLWIGGDLPSGAGLASSAALTVGVATALLALSGQDAPAGELAQLCQSVENDFVAAPCGIMDPLCCTSARAGHALLIDCRHGATKHIPFNLAGAALIVMDTGVVHSIAGAGYAARCSECAQALEALRTMDPSIRHWRDLVPTPAAPDDNDSLRIDNNDGAEGAGCHAAAAVESCRDPDARPMSAPEPRIHGGDDTGHREDGNEQRPGRSELIARLPPLLRRRATHIISENARVRRAVSYLRGGRISAFGLVMTASHASLCDDFDVSCDALDTAVSAALSVAGVYGARMTGGGFGGCAIALVAEERVGDVRTAVVDAFQRRGLAPPTVFPVVSSAGAGVVWRACPV